ncbi:NADH-quinone oxidoreductase subunit NuoE family protein [Romboutsia sp. 1001713B170207_170306_H8]|uniref:NADH-quinone oxidoreductase subunit NuoE family protein n=1 Tax=Romboutsia sp. 1001713B170207_170306_H8 TaxID=2787112 RepID=UPI0008206DA4|nr:NAD(P)H-dependent oxidoreductase subunit E [Romboutsia sp. 1001713B170207_170306_H8]SCH88059.1 NADH-quinone oxidoreductase subunit 2 [uncultured Clostridium sp.]
MCDFISRNSKSFEELDIFINSLDKSEDNVIRTLHYAQKIFRYLPNEVQKYISKKLNISFDKIHDLVNFYSYFTTDLKGEIKIKVCLSGACAKNDSSNILAEFEELLGLKCGETSSDLKFSLDSSRCVGSCRRSPVITINGRVYDNVTLKDVSLILKELK